jgi:hypothetical protein
VADILAVTLWISGQERIEEKGARTAASLSIHRDLGTYS